MRAEGGGEGEEVSYLSNLFFLLSRGFGPVCFAASTKSVGIEAKFGRWLAEIDPFLMRTPPRCLCLSELLSLFFSSIRYHLGIRASK